VDLTKVIQADAPGKFCLKAMDKMFTLKEMAGGRYKPVRAKKGCISLPPPRQKKSCHN